MLKEEFDALAGVESTIQDYELIEFVYNYHPLNFSKETVAKFYNEFGMVIFKDLKPRADDAKELEDVIRRKQTELQELRTKLERLRE